MIKKFNGFKPEIEKDVFTASGCTIIGKVKIKSKSSIWFNAVIRGDLEKITIGKKTNIQENSCLHVDENVPLTLKKNITVGHGAILHGCHIKNNCLIGMGTTILDNAVINENTIIGANTLITQEKEFPPGSLILGSPGKVARKLEKKEIKKIQNSAEHYYQLATKYNN